MTQCMMHGMQERQLINGIFVRDVNVLNIVQESAKRYLGINIIMENNVKLFSKITSNTFDIIVS